MSALYHEPPHQPLAGLAACLQARVLASEYWRGRAGGAACGADGEEAARRRTPSVDPHSNSSTPLVDEFSDAARPPAEARVRALGSLASTDRGAELTKTLPVSEGEGGEEVEESKWQDLIAFRFDQIISFASTAIEDKRRRSDEACNTSPDSGIGHGDAERAAGEGGAARSPSPQAPHHFKKRFFRRERWGAWSGAPPPAPVDWERPPK